MMSDGNRNDRQGSPRCRIAGVLAVVALILLGEIGGLALANGSLLQLAGDSAFREMLLDAPPPPSRGATVGASIVGLRLESPSRDFDPRAIRVLLGHSDAVRNFLCVRFISRDGRYSAQARYKLAPDVATMPVLETRTTYQKQLSAYQSSDIAIMARSAKSCDDPKGGDIFAVALGAPSYSQIVILLNGGEARVRAQLGQNNKAVTQAVICNPLTGDVRVGFTQECRLNLPSDIQPGSYQLSIGETASTGEIVVRTNGLIIYRAADDAR
jgi:hypothetical protein